MPFMEREKVSFLQLCLGCYRIPLRSELRSRADTVPVLHPLPVGTLRILWDEAHLPLLPPVWEGA